MIDRRLVPQQILSNWKEVFEAVSFCWQFGFIWLKVTPVYADLIVD
jgi:hypothetical protein